MPALDYHAAVKIFLVSICVLIVLCAVAWGEASELAVLPDVEFRALDGEKTVRLSDYRGKSVLLTFWASWCGPCREELPELAELSRELEKSGFVLLTVNVDQNKSAAKKFLERFSIDVPVFRAERSDLARLGIRGLPTSMLIDLEGRRVQLYEGYFPTVVEDIRHRVLAMTGKQAEQPPGEWIEDS